MDAEAFWKRAMPVPGTDCMEWQGARSRKYRMVLFQGKLMGAHRASWIISHGEIPPGLWVCHKCDNPPCVNPDHLFLGTCTDNNRDMTAKGRNVPPVGARHWATISPMQARGERNGSAKLTQAQVDVIKLALADGARPSVLAKAYGVRHATICAIRRGDTWGERHGSMYRSLERVVEALGHRRTLREWSAAYGVSAKTIAARLAHGWDADRAVSCPVRRWTDRGSSPVTHQPTSACAHLEDRHG